MESLRVGIFCLFSISLSGGAEAMGRDYTPTRRAIHEMRDAIHQVGYNYPSWPSPGTWWEHKPGKLDVEKQKHTNEEVTVLDQYHRVAPDGAVEFKVALSDGQINHQKIYRKSVNGTSVLVHDGYYSVRLGDGRYRTTYYRADEMGYRVFGYVDTAPPTGLRIEDIERAAQSKGSIF